jgi:hypothetical protein
MTSVGVDAVVERLRGLGFEKRSGLIFTLPLDGGSVLAWVGLNKASHRGRPGEVLLNPVVGVRHQGVERVVGDLRGEKFHGYLPPTVSLPLRYLVPAEARRDWVVMGGTADAEVADRLVGAVDRYGFEFMRGASDVPGLIAALRAGRGPAHQNAYRLPVALLAAGGLEEALSFVDDELRALGDRADPAAEEFRRFAARLRATAWD